MKIIVTGASGNFGSATVRGLLKTVPPHDLIVVTRDPRKLAALSAQGVDVRRGDYNDAQSLRTAFAGGERMLLISALKVGFRIPHHARCP